MALTKSVRSRTSLPVPSPRSGRSISSFSASTSQLPSKTSFINASSNTYKRQAVTMISSQQRTGLSGVRCYARRPKPAQAASQVVAKPKKQTKAKLPPRKAEEDDDDFFDESEAANYPDLSQPYEESDVPEEARKPMKEIKLPKQRFVFNYKTYRYKDLQADDPERITSSWTAPAHMGPQVRAGEGLEAIRHTKENPGEDLSKDEILLEQNKIPVGLDAPVVPYVTQITRAVYGILKEEKGEDIVVIDISGKTNWLPTMVIVTAMSSRHVVALANRVSAELKRSKLCKSPRIERNVGDEWAIVATGTTIVEILTPEQREYMDLERLWVLKKSAQETFEFDEEEERFMYDEEDGMWDDDDPDF